MSNELIIGKALAFDDDLQEINNNLTTLDNKVTTHLDNYAKNSRYKSRYGFTDASITDTTMSTTNFTANIDALYTEFGALTNFTIYADNSSNAKLAASIAKKLNDDLSYGATVATGFILEITFNSNNSIPSKIFIYPNNSDDVIYINYDNGARTAKKLAYVSDINTKLDKSSMAKGSTSITPTAANTATSKVLSWSLNAEPVIQLTPATSRPSAVALGYVNQSANGCTVWLERPDVFETYFSYTAIV